jgi:fatty-acid desaturase
MNSYLFHMSFMWAEVPQFTTVEGPDVRNASMTLLGEPQHSNHATTQTNSDEASRKWHWDIHIPWDSVRLATLIYFKHARALRILLLQELDGSLTF